jgi:hypothetical protein
VEIVGIDEPERLDLLPLKEKSQTWHWKFTFTRLHEPRAPTIAALAAVRGGRGGSGAPPSSSAAADGSSAIAASQKVRISCMPSA